MKISSMAGVFLFVSLTAGLANAQGVGAAGGLRGQVADPTGAAVPKAAVVATDTERGTRFSAITDNSGQYRISGLIPGTYDVEAQAPGFGSVVQRRISVSVGEVGTVDFNLSVAKAATAVEVTAEAPAIDTIQGKQADIINQNLVDSLPINRRDYLTFTLLLPGVSDSTRVADDQDFRVKQTPTSGLSFYGSNGRGNSITVDGGDTGDDGGGVRMTVSQDAVQEFQVNRSN